MKTNIGFQLGMGSRSGSLQAKASCDEKPNQTKVGQSAAVDRQCTWQAFSKLEYEQNYPNSQHCSLR